MDRVKGKVAVVTGAARGIGRATAQLLAREGARVIVADLDEAGGQQTVGEITTSGGQAVFIRHDVRAEGDFTSHGPCSAPWNRRSRTLTTSCRRSSGHGSCRHGCATISR
jgi:NAD(P)-dependent dehydrogenase (short-subunit alcohol dehydrogenase family)